jgi:hypothetical protein
MLREQLAHIGLAGSERQVAYVDLRHKLEISKSC